MKACIFDLDGTLTDTLESLVYSVRATLREMGLPEITKEQCRTFVGNGARRLMEESLAAVGDENAERLEEGMQVVMSPGPHLMDGTDVIVRPQ